MKRLVMVAAVYAALIATAGWIRESQAESADDNIRMEQMLYQSEDLRQIREEWRRFWRWLEWNEFWRSDLQSPPVLAINVDGFVPELPRVFIAE